MATDTNDRITLNDGASIPQLGFGTLSIQPDREDSRENAILTANLVGFALEVGYRHIDTAQSYGTERGVGEAIAASGVPRDQIFVTSKLSNRNHHPDDVRSSFEESLQKLGLEYLDLFLIHWPLPTLYEGDFVSTWRAMIELLEDGRLRTAGVSNFEAPHLERIIRETGVVPAINQIELHPHFRNEVTAAASKKNGIVVEAWSPLGQGNVLDDEVIGGIASSRGKSPAQIILRWHIQHGNVVIPKSANRQRIEENFAVTDFELSSDEIEVIDALDRGEAGRRGPHPNTFDWLP
jgi:2,5-diketo-D-gluconate reductase A